MGVSLVAAAFPHAAGVRFVGRKDKLEPVSGKPPV